MAEANNVNIEQLAEQHKQLLEKFVSAVHDEIEALPHFERIHKAQTMAEQIKMDEAVDLANIVKQILLTGEPLLIIESSLTLFRRKIYHILSGQVPFDTFAIATLKNTKEKLKRLYERGYSSENDFQYTQDYINSITSQQASSAQ